MRASKAYKRFLRAAGPRRNGRRNREVESRPAFLRDNQHFARCQARQLLRDTAEQKAGQTATAAPAENKNVGLLAPHRADDRFRWVAPSGLHRDGRGAVAKRALSRLAQDLVGGEFQRFAEVAFCARELPQFRPGDISAYRQNDELEAGRFRQRRRGINRTICAGRAVGCDYDALHGEVWSRPLCRGAGADPPEYLRSLKRVVLS